MRAGKKAMNTERSSIEKVVASMRDEAKRSHGGSIQEVILARYADAIESAVADDATFANALKNEFARRRRERWIRRAVAFVSVATIAYFVADYQSRRLAGFVTCAPGYFDQLVGDYAVCSTSDPWPMTRVVPLER